MSFLNRALNYNVTNTAGSINVQTGTFGSIVASTGITTGTLSATTITGSNLSLSGNLNIAGTLTAVNITATNLVDTNISTGTLSATGLAILTNVASTNTSMGTLNAATGITTAGLAATTITGANLSLSGGITCATLNVNTLFTNMSGANATFTNITAGGIRITSGSLQFANLSSMGTIWRNSGGAEVAKIYDSSTLYIWSDDSVYFDIGANATAASTKMFVNTSGLGIGTTTPRSVLDVNGNMIINRTMYFGNTYTQANNGPRITENWGVTLVANGTDQPVRVTAGALLVGYGGNGANFGTNANLLVSSNVGIGTTTASYRLSINTTGDTPSINPDAYNSLIVAEDMSGAAVRSGTLAGSAIYNQNTGGTTGYVQLTDAAVNQNGQYYWNFNPGNAFTADWEAQTTGSGEDFLFFWGATSAPPTNAGSGARGDSSYSIEFDHANDTIRLYYDSTQLAAVAQAMGNSTSWFKFRVVYQRNTIRVYYNNTLVINYKDTARSLNLSNSFTGFTAWTSATNSAHRIRDIRIQKFTEGLWSYQSQTSANIMYYGGNVGIGTTNPSYTLDVTGTIRASQGLTVGYGADNGISFYGNTATNKLIETVWTGSVDQTNIYTPGNNSGTAKLTLQSNNCVGINTTSPAYTLDVNSNTIPFGLRLLGTSAESTVIRFENTSGSGGTWHVGATEPGSTVGRGFSFYDVTNSALRMIIGSTGNLGIGTATPAYPLDIVSNTIGTIRATYPGMGAGVNDVIMFGQGASNNNYGILDFNYITSGNSSNSIGLGFFGGNNKLVVNANGRVGINTTNPSHTLHVVSGAATDAMTLENTNASGGATMLYKTNTNIYFTTGVGGANTGTYADKWYVSCSVDPNRAIVMTSNGNFGVNTASPVAPLHVVNSTSFPSGAYAFYSFNGTTANTGTSSGTQNASIYAAERVVAREFNAFSDQRIKKDIVDVSDSSALSILRQIEPKQYKYRDVASRGTQPVWGFVAQQVRSVLDYATALRTDFIPNIYEVADVTNTHTITLSTATTTDLTVNQRIRLIKSDDEFVETKITGIVSAHTFTVEDAISTEKVFVFGSEVEDFHTLNKDAIFTIATAALQEVDREMQAENEKLSILEQFIQSKFPGEYTP